MTETTKNNQHLTVIQGDTLEGKYLRHLPIEGKFEQLRLFRYPDGTFKYIVDISGEYRFNKPFGTWEYTKVHQSFYWIDIEKTVSFFPDSTIIKSDFFGRIKYDSDSSNVEAFIIGIYSKVLITCQSEQCIFQSLESSANKFCFEQKQLDTVIEQIREGYPEIGIFMEFGQKNCR